MHISQAKSLLIILVLILAPAVAFSASVSLRWQANNEPDISGYNIYYGTSSRNYGLPIPVGNATSHTVDNLTEGATYYFSVTARDTSGNESGYSSEVTANATSSNPVTEPYRLLLSTRSDRSNAVELNGQTISSGVYIFLDPEAYVSQVVFSIDGQTHNTENYAPYDLGEPFDTSTLSNGSHTISAQVRLQDGTTQNINAVCTVSNITATASTNTEPYRLMLSRYSNRSGAVDLNGQSISGNVYIFLNLDASSVSRVTFSVDGQTHNTESTVPYDLGLPFNTNQLSNGSHTISAQVRLQDGTTQNINAVCTVSNITATASTNTEPYRLMLSRYSNRSGAVNLNGQSISGNVYIFLNLDASSVSRVTFSVDGQTHNTESTVPYDLGLPFNTNQLSNGSHTISAQVRLQDGTTQNINAVCTVSNITATASTNTEPYRLMLSRYSNRSGAVDLNGQSISGNVYIFLNLDASSVSRVTFSVDGQTHNTESTVPYDLGLPFNTNQLSNGSHTISAQVRLQDGTTQNINAVCTIDN